MRACLLLLVSSLAMSTQSPNKAIVTVGTAPTLPYSHAVKSGGLVYTSGVLAQDAGGNIVPKGDIKGQTKAVIERLREVLTAAGSSLDQVVSVTVYLKSAGDFAAMNEVYSGFWTKDPPTRTTVVAGFARPDALVEISMIAVPTGAERVVIHPASWIKSPSPYSYAIRTGDTVFLSGLVVAQRPRQLGRDGGHQRANDGRARQRDRAPQGCRHDHGERRQLARVPTGWGQLSSR